ncbi:unnamed protein product [Parnassius mnemosyne]|uniref:PHD-type domain-containing protein n=1 Tax=Parnassius mnemosyne TaxID=213953 RepID=A0AAV1LR43_9NEOP
MPQARVKFGCCERQTSTPNTLSCYSCKIKYHLNCVNIKKSLKDLPEEFKSKWSCPCCRSKIPKFDNTDTPIKATTSQPESDSEDFSTNVNLRRGTVQNAEVSADSIRQIVREELECILESFKTNIIKQLELKTKEILDKFNQISESMSKVESQLEHIQNEVQSNCKKINILESENTTLRKTWLNNGCYDAEIFASGYVVYRRDRETSPLSGLKKGGGVLIAVSERLASRRIVEWETDCEDVWVSVTPNSTKNPVKILLCAVYLPPSVTKHTLDIFIDKANGILGSRTDREYTLIASDYNLSRITWLGNHRNDTFNHMLPSGFGGNELLCKFINFISLNNLKQFNCVTNIKNKILDLILCN